MARPNRTRERIVEAAIAAAAAEGVSATTMDGIAARAQVAKGSLYYNFSGKDELFAAALTETGGVLLDELETRVAARSGPEALAAFARGALHLLRANPDLASVLPSELLRVDRPWREATDALRARLVDLARRAMLAARPDLAGGAGGDGGDSVDGGDGAGGARGDGAGDDDATVAAVSLLGAILMTGVHWGRTRPDLEVERVVEGLVRTFARPGADAPRR